METTYYTVTRINGDYAIMISDSGTENTVAMALLPMETYEGTRLIWENLEYSLV